MVRGLAVSGLVVLGDKGYLGEAGILRGESAGDSFEDIWEP